MVSLSLSLSLSLFKTHPLVSGWLVLFVSLGWWLQATFRLRMKCTNIFHTHTPCNCFYFILFYLSLSPLWSSIDSVGSLLRRESSYFIQTICKIKSAWPNMRQIEFETKKLKEREKERTKAV